MDQPALAEHPAAVIIGVLLMLSGTLVVTTLFTGISAALIAIWLAAGLIGPGAPRPACGCG